MNGFDFAGDFPAWDDTATDDDLAAESQSFNDQVDYLVNVRGYTQADAEEYVLAVMMDDAA